ncbi:SDR family NAD(P)-dependent oxidoreductase [Nonomuraea dietziae]|uniref:SDR family NAD(P)-dependent oxidoreductase n=1 Tax=Nonomuraea dietziae TaxID=65515 RepID=UPI0033C81011
MRRPESVADLEAAYPDTCLIAKFDARDIAAAADLVRDTLDRFGQLDVLVNNAGRAVVGAVEEVSDAHLRELMDLHLFGPAALVRAALPAMRGRPGSSCPSRTATRCRCGCRSGARRSSVSRVRTGVAWTRSSGGPRPPAAPGRTQMDRLLDGLVRAPVRQGHRPS